MISTTLFPGRYVQGADSIQRLGMELSRFGQKGFAICTPFIKLRSDSGDREGLLPKLPVQKARPFITSQSL